MIDYEQARPEDYVDGLYIGAMTTLEHVNELQHMAKEYRRQRVVNLILEQRIIKHLQDPWRTENTEPLSKRAYDLGIENGIIETLAEEGLAAV